MPRAFTAQQLLADAADEYAEAIYRFRKVEHESSEEYCAAKSAMNKAEANVAYIREHIYRKEEALLFDNKCKSDTSSGRAVCPAPAWLK